MIAVSALPVVHPGPIGLDRLAGLPLASERPPSPIMRPLDGLAAAFDPINLEQMDDVALLERVEVKYLLPASILPGILAELATGYRVLQVAGARLCRYRTLYFDTPDLSLYRRHHAGALDCYKVRSREYVESRSDFLEVKHKTNKRRTLKHRIETAGMATCLGDEVLVGFLAGVCPFCVQDLRPCLWNTYTRITLVNKTQPERVTIDLDLVFSWLGRRTALSGLVVAELKQERSSRGSPFVSLMHQCRVHSTGFSKFCMGVSLLHPGVKQNNFKAKHRMVARLLGGGRNDVH